MYSKNCIKYVLIFMIFCLNTIQASDTKEKLADLATLNHEIVLLNLVNGLHLTDDQVESLIEKIKEAERTKEDYYDHLYTNKNEFENILEDLKQNLLKNKEIPEALKKQIHEMKKRQHELEDQKGKRLITIQREIKEILTQNQLILIQEFKPCTIPPKTGRIGQSVETGTERLVRLLEKIRNMHPEKYDSVKNNLVEMHLEKIERYIQKFSETERNEYREKILNTYEKARTLSEKAFLMQKNTLAQTIMPEPETNITLRKYQLDKVGKFVLNEIFLNILKEKFGK